MEAAVTGFVLAAASGLVLAAATFWLARKSGLQPAQAALINTLKDNANAMEDKISRLTAELAEQKDRRILLEKKVARMEGVILGMATENAELRKKLGMTARLHKIVAADIDEIIESE
jgi:uncharacterized membrane protein affecting hemolysin expression